MHFGFWFDNVFKQKKRIFVGVMVLERDDQLETCILNVLDLSISMDIVDNITINDVGVLLWWLFEVLSSGATNVRT